MYILSNQVDVIGFLGSNEYKGLDEFYAVRLKAAAKYYGLEVFNMLYDDADIKSKIPDYITNITKSELNVAIFTTIDDTTVITPLLDELNSLKSGGKNTPKLIYLEGGLTIEKIKGLSSTYLGYNEGNLIFRGYDDSMVNSYTKKYINEYKSQAPLESDNEAIYMYIHIYIIIIK